MSVTEILVNKIHNDEDGKSEELAVIKTSVVIVFVVPATWANLVGKSEELDNGYKYVCNCI